MCVWVGGTTTMHDGDDTVHASTDRENSVEVDRAIKVAIALKDVAQLLNIVERQRELGAQSVVEIAEAEQVELARAIVVLLEDALNGGPRRRIHGGGRRTRRHLRSRTADTTTLTHGGVLLFLCWALGRALDAAPNQEIQ